MAKLYMSRLRARLNRYGYSSRFPTLRDFTISEIHVNALLTTSTNNRIHIGSRSLTFLSLFQKISESWGGASENAAEFFHDRDAQVPD